MQIKLKRMIYFIASATGLIILTPILGLVSLCVWIFMGVPILYRQERIGWNGETFRIYKFRTMTDVLDAEENLLPDTERLTRFGRFLRASSLDELPELVNVLKGEMSIVGPRPLHTRYRDRYSAFQWRRHEVRPGITGWVQINGRNALTWDKKFELDVWYVDHWNLWLDLKIFMATLWIVFRMSQVNESREETMPEFMGNTASDRSRRAGFSDRGGAP